MLMSKKESMGGCEGWDMSIKIEKLQFKLLYRSLWTNCPHEQSNL